MFAIVSGCTGAVTRHPVSRITTTTGPRFVTTTAKRTIAAAPVLPGPDVQRLLNDERRTYGSPGALAVVQIGDRHWFVSSGTADTQGTEITSRTRFRIASITKPLVAALVLDAASRHELSLDDVVNELLPGLLRPDQPITVRMLLNHTSGVFDEASDGNPGTDVKRLINPQLRHQERQLLARRRAGQRVVYSDQLLVALAETHPRYFAPGTSYHYSRTDYQLAAMVLEHVTHSSLSTLMSTRIAGPLGLRHTTLAPADLGSPELRGYGPNRTPGELVDLTDDLTLFGNGGSGGVMATADDILIILRAIVSGRLLPAVQVDDMKTATVQSKNLYGLGLITYHLTCGVFYGHEGGVAGTASIAIVSNRGDMGAVIALNWRGSRDPQLPALADKLLCT